MGCLGNVIWFLCGGVILGLSWLLTGCLWCITIIGIPVGMQCFKFAALSFFPVWKGDYLWRRCRFPLAEYHMVACLGTSTCN